MLVKLFFALNTMCHWRVICSISDVQAEGILNGDVIRKRKEKRWMEIIDSDYKSLSNCNRAEKAPIFCWINRTFSFLSNLPQMKLVTKHLGDQCVGFSAIQQCGCRLHLRNVPSSHLFLRWFHKSEKHERPSRDNVFVVSVLGYSRNNVMWLTWKRSCSMNV